MIIIFIKKYQKNIKKISKKYQKNIKKMNKECENLTESCINCNQNNCTIC